MEEKNEKVQETKEGVNESQKETQNNDNITENVKNNNKNEDSPAKDEELKREVEDIMGDLSKDEEEILKFIEESKPNIYVVGTGGSGTNTLTRLFEMGVDDVVLIAANTDARHLLKTKAHRKILLGKQLTKGRGCGSNPECGEKSALEAADKIKEILSDADLVFITCGLGGGTGTGSAPIISKIAKNDLNALTIGVVTLPFNSEGKIRMENAISGLKKLRANVDTLIVIKNDRLLSIAPDLPLETAFKISDEVLAGAVKSISELVTKAGLVNVDFSDLQTVLKDAGYAVIGVGEATLESASEDRARIAIETALSSPLLDANISNARRVLINIIGGEDLSLREVEYIVSETAKRVHPDAHIIFGARIQPDMKKSALKVLVVVAGVDFITKSEKKENVTEELDLEIL